MTDSHSLFEFMPYGAPELLEARRAHLLRALGLASALAAAVFFIARAGGWSIAPREIVLPPALGPSHTMDPPPSIMQPSAPVPSVVSPPSAGPAVPVPVADPDVPQTQAPAPTTQTGTGTTATPGDVAPPPGGGTGGTAIVPDEALPNLGDFVVVDELPVVATRFDPVYPDLALEAGIGGRVYVFMLVGRDGHVVRVAIDPRQSVPLLDEAATAAAKRWVFTPATTNGHPVAVWVGQAFVFTPRR